MTENNIALIADLLLHNPYNYETPVLYTTWNTYVESHGHLSTSDLMKLLSDKVTAARKAAPNQGLGAQIGQDFEIEVIKHLIELKARL